MPGILQPALVPELLVASLDSSIEFWCGLCGFKISYSRPDERFVAMSTQVVPTLTI